MQSFHSARDAKDFLVTRIVAEAEREQVSLSGVERKMLYHSETSRASDEMIAISDEFDREYDQDNYEKKIANLLRRAYRAACSGDQTKYEAWWQAISRLRRGDHYLVVMIDMAGLRPRGDQFKLLVTALAISASLLFGIIFLAKHNIDPADYLPSRGTIAFALWAMILSAAVIYSLVGFLAGREIADNWTGRVLESFGRLFLRKK